ncbi:hypothetical protein MG293_012030 [Ovis ammon polii]|uniref:Uncharacterized protein n=1 Tax=Ovis ammon polii TaxID=230172 RepID=A0AAD4U5F2_OVIAM|nr:hypothetical protein MG293_012030 [Ovis ammon polii]
MHEETPKLSDISECVCLNDSLSDVPVCPQKRGHAALDLLAEPISLTLKFKTSISPLFSLVLKNVQVNFVRRPDWDTDLDTDSNIVTAFDAFGLRQSWSCHFLTFGLKISLTSVQSQDKQQGCSSRLLLSEVCRRVGAIFTYRY